MNRNSLRRFRILNDMKCVFGGLSAALLFCGNAAHAADGFATVRCGSDVPKALIGRTMSNERVVVGFDVAWPERSETS